MPFEIALNAETRQKLIEQVKKLPEERANIDSIVDIRDKNIPEAKAKFIGKS